MSVPYRIANLLNAYNLVIKRAGISETQTDLVDNVKSYIGEWNDKITTERDWHWRIFNRSFIVSPAITTGTVAVTNNSRIVTFTGLTLTTQYLGRSIKIDGEQEMYRIVGINVSANQAFLESLFVGTTSATASYKMFQYEFSLPPDCDNIINAFVSGRNEMDEISPNNFNRVLTLRPDANDFPYLYSRYGLSINPDSMVPNLGEWVLAYDFLGRDDDEGILGDKFSVYPINPKSMCKVDIEYSMHTPGYGDKIIPLMPITDRWILVNLALFEHYRSQNNLALANSYYKPAMKRLREMRSEYKVSDSRPKMIYDGRISTRESLYSSNRKYPRITDWEAG